jgi:hypothetical protein
MIEVFCGLAAKSKITWGVVVVCVVVVVVGAAGVPVKQSC